MPISGKEMLKRYKAAGWQVLRIRGSHYHLVKDNKFETIPVHKNKDLKKGIEQKLLKNLKS